MFQSFNNAFGVIGFRFVLSYDMMNVDSLKILGYLLIFNSVPASVRMSLEIDLFL